MLTGLTAVTQVPSYNGLLAHNLTDTKLRPRITPHIQQDRNRRMTSESAKLGFTSQPGHILTDCDLTEAPSLLQSSDSSSVR